MMSSPPVPPALTNRELKSGNEKIFDLLGDRLKSDSERTFVKSAEKLARFISRNEAYYPEARPKITELLKMARATLTRLNNSISPFQYSNGYLNELESRVNAYVRLVSVTPPYIDNFKDDKILYSEMKDIIASISATADSGEGGSSQGGVLNSIMSMKMEGNEPPISSISSVPSPVPVESPSSMRISLSPGISTIPPSAADKPIPRNRKKLKLAKPAKVDPSLLQQDLERFSSRHSISPLVKGVSTPLINKDKEIRSPMSIKSPDNINFITAAMEKISTSALDGQETPRVRASTPNTGHSNMIIDSNTKNSVNTLNGGSDVMIADQANQNHRSGTSKNHTEPWDSPSLLTKNCSLTSVSYLSLEIGKAPGAKMGLNSDLTSEQHRLITVWKGKNRLKQDQSNSLCISLACYKLSDVIQASFKHDDDANFVFGTEQLLYLNSTWPTDGGIIATFGNHRISLAPPRFVSAESLVDISQYIEGEAVRICLEQFSDMSQFVFALVVHPPTPSQLQNAKNLSNNRLKDRIRITYEDVFGHVH